MRGSPRTRLFRVCLICALAAPSAFALSPPADAKPKVHRQNQITPPPKPAPIKFGDSLWETPATLIASLTDTGYWNAVFGSGDRAPGVIASATSPVSGFITGIAVHGNAVSGPYPQPGGGQPFRISVLGPLTKGGVQLVTTSDPHFVLPPTTGTYGFAVGPPATTFAMPIKVGQSVAFDTSGGTWNVFGTATGSSVDSFSQAGSQSAGAVWMPSPHHDSVVQLQISVQPTISTADLDAAATDVNAALGHERDALATHRMRKRRKALRKAKSALESAKQAIRSAFGDGELSGTSRSTLLAVIQSAETSDAGGDIQLADSFKQTTLRLIKKAEQLASKVH